MEYYTKEQEQWLKENWSSTDSREETTKKFNNLFKANRTEKGLRTKANSLGVKKTKQLYLKGHKNWKEGLSKEEQLKHFSKDKWKSMTSRYVNFPNVQKRLEWEKKNGKIPKGYILSDLGNGEYMLMEEKIHKIMRFYKQLGQGDFTRTQYEIHLAKRTLDKITGKQCKLKPMSIEQKKQCRERLSKYWHIKKLDNKKVETIKLLKGKLPRKQIAEMFGISEKTVYNYQKEIEIL